MSSAHGLRVHLRIFLRYAEARGSREAGLSNLSIATPEPPALFAGTVAALGVSLGFLAQVDTWQPQADGALVADAEAELREFFATDLRLDELAFVEQFDRDPVAERRDEPHDRRAGK